MRRSRLPSTTSNLHILNGRHISSPDQFKVKQVMKISTSTISSSTILQQTELVLIARMPKPPDLILSSHVKRWKEVPRQDLGLPFNWKQIGTLYNSRFKARSSLFQRICWEDRRLSKNSQSSKPTHLPFLFHFFRPTLLCLRRAVRRVKKRQPRSHKSRTQFKESNLSIHFNFHFFFVFIFIYSRPNHQSIISHVAFPNFYFRPKSDHPIWYLSAQIKPILQSVSHSLSFFFLFSESPFPEPVFSNCSRYPLG